MRSMSARALAALLAAAAVAVRAAGCGAERDPAAAQSLPRLDAQTSLLVVAPHPDDETLCCAGVIQRVVRAGGRASVVWITSGDASELDLLLIEKSLFVRPQQARDLAVRRMREARTASARLGVPAARQLFLGYPDRGVLRLLTDHRATPYTSGFTGAAAVPYPAALFPGHPYTGESLERDFGAVLERIHPTLILAPSPRDSHPDHRAAGLLTIAVSTRSGMLPGVRYWIVHGGEGWPSPRGLLPGVPLTAAPRSRGPLAVFALEPAEEDRMLEALRAYDTQMRTQAPFLLAFVRSTELFASLPGAPLAP
jgi:LmbE family N-acetylglucosaminyl deacetylase